MSAIYKGDLHIKFLKHKLVKYILSILRKSCLRTRNSVQGKRGLLIHMQFTLSKLMLALKIGAQFGNVYMFHNMQKSQIPWNVTYQVCAPST